MFRQHGGHSRRGGSQEWTQQVEQVPADLHLPHVWSKEHHLQQAELVGTRHMQSHVNLIGLGGHGHFWTIQISVRRRVLCKDIGKHTNFKSSVLR